MSDEQQAKSKVEIKIGNLSFAAEGDQNWLGEQLSKVLDAASPVISQTQAAAATDDNAAGGALPPARPIGSLASYLKATGGETKQVQRFLAAAGWLFRRGEEKLTATAVTKALAENHQKRLGNPADCLNKNCSKGLCEKQKDHFFITPEGWKALGEDQ